MALFGFAARNAERYFACLELVSDLSSTPEGLVGSGEQHEAELAVVWSFARESG